MMRFSQVDSILGTTVRILVEEEASREPQVLKSISAAFQEARRIEHSYSRFLPDNELARLNRSIGTWAEVSEELYGLLQVAQELKVVSDGAFDVTVKSLLEGWGYDSNYSLQEQASGAIGTIQFRVPLQVKISASVDLGGLGKGYALDQMRPFLADFENVLVEAGGDLWARGLDEHGKPWHVLFEHPADLAQAIGFVEIPPEGLALASSSPNRRQWRDRHHLVDPCTSEPSNAMLAVYTQAKTALLADAYATLLFVMGFEAVSTAIEKFPIEAMWVSPKGEIRKTPGFCGELFSASEPV